ncbi:MAG: prephenate dehydrogenase [Lachnospiraceae bacterium]|jgi:prephenate dehydrogenase|nr:prephenate dehydrogenase [Lachnospiraceae bacterium]
MKLNKIGFIGLGLIGGSIAKAIKKYYPHSEIYGTAYHEETVREAYCDGIILNNSQLSIEFFYDMDVIFLCSPVKINNEYLKALKYIVKESCIITDVGSVKSEINSLAESLDMSSNFIGGHPMTGKETVGFSNADPLILENAFYIVTPASGINEETSNEFIDFITHLHAIPIVVSPEKHDFAAAVVSHLPHIISASLVKILMESDSKDQLMKTIAAGGFRDITRISSSSPIMWQNICLSNKEAVLQAIDIFQRDLASIKDSISDENTEEILKFFSEAKEYRDSLPIKSPGSIAPSYEFYSDMEDKVGGIAMVSRLLADNNISLKNIGIINNREFEEGVLRIEFYDSNAMNKANETLKKHNYTLHTKS